MHSWFGSTMWNRPIVVAPLVGLALGDLDTGIAWRNIRVGIYGCISCWRK